MEEWSFDLPADRIAREPLPRRDASRLLVVNRASTGQEDRFVADLPEILRPGDLLVANDTRVMPARLEARRSTGGGVELLVLGPGPGPVEVMLKPSRRLRAGERLFLRDGRPVELLSDPSGGTALASFPDDDPLASLEALGTVPLPPYLDRQAGPADRERYQTIFARESASAAAPTAGLHFTRELLAALAAQGIGLATVTLHVGIGTFRPLRPEDLAAGRLHRERWEVSEEAAAAIAATRRAGGRIVAVGTTSARTLEAATPVGASIPVPGRGETDLFICPGYSFRALDALFTNFHLPGSSLLLLVGALLGRDRTLAAYHHAIHQGYRFYSYGDAMLVL
jgi:S-adenosylmethionine:tRNA ribosyltransferase-isomerase